MNTSINQDTNPESEVAAAEGSYRDALPTHFTFKIQSFSLLHTFYSMEKFESNDFEAGGYKWKLVFYPNGNNTIQTGSSSESQHVSMFLKIVSTDSLPPGWVLDVSFRFFVFDQIRDRYLIIGDMGGKTRRFNETKTMWGYSQLLPLTTLKDSSNGYLVNDVCVFGAEVFPCKSTGCGDCLTMVNNPSTFKYTWKIGNFSKIREKFIYSDVFNIEELKWNILVFPRGDYRANKDNLSLYLRLNDLDVEVPGVQVLAVYRLRLRGQTHNLHKETVNSKKWFDSSNKFWGRSNFMTLDELNDVSNGYLVNDSCFVEAEVTVLGVLKKLSYNNPPQLHCVFPMGNPAPPLPQTNWTLPPIGFIKINVDGACIGGQIAAGAIARNHLGGFVGCMSKFMDFGTPIEAQAEAFLLGIKLIRDLNLRYIILEGDAKKLVDSINNSSITCSRRVLSRVQLCRDFVRQRDDVEVSFSPKSSNGVAHTLARFSVTFNVTNVWIGGLPPPPLLDALFSDLANIVISPINE